MGRAELSNLFNPTSFDWGKIKSNVRNIFVIHDREDSIVPYDHGEFIAGELDARLILTNGRGHYITEDRKKNTKLPVVLKLLTEK